MNKRHSGGLSTDCLAIEGAFSNYIAGIFLKHRNSVSLFLAFVSYKHFAVTTGWFKKLWYFQGSRKDSAKELTMSELGSFSMYEKGRVPGLF